MSFDDLVAEHKSLDELAAEHNLDKLCLEIRHILPLLPPYHASCVKELIRRAKEMRLIVVAAGLNMSKP